MTTVDLIVLAIPAVFAAGAFYLAGELIRRRMREGGVPPHPLLDDLHGLEVAFVDFFGSSKTSSGILNVLARHTNPIGFKALAAEVRGKCTNSIHHDEIPLMAMRAVLRILLFSRLARMGVDGFAITELGREVHRRMQARGGQDDPSEPGGLPEKTKEIVAKHESLPQEAPERRSAVADCSPRIGKVIEDRSVAAEIRKIEARINKRHVKPWADATINPFCERYEAIAARG